MTSLKEFANTALDEKPLDSFHWRVLTLIIAGLFFDLFDVAILGSLIPDLIAQGFATPPQLAVIASATFAGLLLGSVAQGELTDRYGRKFVYQANLLLYGAATIVSAFSTGYEMFAAARFVAGIGLGAEIPLAYAYAAEFSPRRSRGRIMAILNLVGGNAPFPLAILFTLAFRDILGWRGILACIGICALLVFLFRISLPESPRWLITRGRFEEAIAILGRMGIDARSLALSPPVHSPTVHDPIVYVLVHFTRRVIALMIALFAAFAALYGLVTWLPSLMGAQGFSITKSLTFTLAMTTAFPVSSILLALFIDRIGRKRFAIASFALAGLCALLFQLSTADWEIIIVGFLMSLFTVTAANALEILCGELFPTNARSTGSGLGFGAGRLGAVIASSAIPALLAASGAGSVYVLIAGVLIVGALATAALGLEPARLALEDIAPTDEGSSNSLPAQSRVADA